MHLSMLIRQSLSKLVGLALKSETKLICESVMALYQNLGCLSHILDGKRFVLVANHICASLPLSSETSVKVFPQCFTSNLAQA